MSFFNIKTTWSNAEFIPFKLCIASDYILVGVCFYNYFQENYNNILVLFGISASSLNEYTAHNLW